jgi:hypothetical protein
MVYEDDFDDEELEEKPQRHIPYEQYFGEMDIDSNKKDKRISFSKKLGIALVALFLWLKHIEKTQTNIQQAKLRLKQEYTKSLGDENIDDYLADYIEEISESIIDSTLRNIDDDYFLSEDRAMYIAENEANTSYAYIEYIQAIKQGKTRKQWLDIKDNKERKTHLRVGSEVKPIREPFKVGDSLMLFPKDKKTYSADDKEVVNCRCSIRYF